LAACCLGEWRGAVRTPPSPPNNRKAASLPGIAAFPLSAEANGISGERPAGGHARTHTDLRHLTMRHRTTSFRLLKPRASVNRGDQKVKRLCAGVEIWAAAVQLRTINKCYKFSSMNHGPALVIFLTLAACGQLASTDQSESDSRLRPHENVRTSFLSMTEGDPWAQWPKEQDASSDSKDQSCERVSQKARDKAIALLAKAPAVEIRADEYRQLTGKAPPLTAGTLFLLRGFATTNSAARVSVEGDAVTVHSDALGGMFNLRRHPCIASLTNRPSRVYINVGYDL